MPILMLMLLPQPTHETNKINNKCKLINNNSNYFTNNNMPMHLSNKPKLLLLVNQQMLLNKLAVQHLKLPRKIHKIPKILKIQTCFVNPTLNKYPNKHYSNNNKHLLKWQLNNNSNNKTNFVKRMNSKFNNNSTNKANPILIIYRSNICKSANSN